MTNGKEKWESVGFYAKEAIEKDLEVDKKIKIWCLLGKAYLELGFIKKAEDCFRHSKTLDKDDNYLRFRIKYSKKSNDQSSFLRLNHSGARTSKRAEREAWIEKSRTDKCFVLDIDRRGTILYGNAASVTLNVRETELLKLFFEFKDGLTKYEIINNITTQIKEKSPDSVKTDINRLRNVIKKGLEVEADTLIQTVGKRSDQKYVLNKEVEVHLIE